MDYTYIHIMYITYINGDGMVIQYVYVYTYTDDMLFSRRQGYKAVHLPGFHDVAPGLA